MLFQCLYPQAFQKELGKRTSSVQALKRSARELMETGRDDTAWVKVQLQELSNRWDTVCALSVTKQTRLQQALKQVREEAMMCDFLSFKMLLCHKFSIHLEKLNLKIVLTVQCAVIMAIRTFLSLFMDTSLTPLLPLPPSYLPLRRRSSAQLCRCF